MLGALMSDMQDYFLKREKCQTNLLEIHIGLYMALIWFFFLVFFHPSQLTCFCIVFALIFSNGAYTGNTAAQIRT